MTSPPAITVTDATLDTLPAVADLMFRTIGRSWDEAALRALSAEPGAIMLTATAGPANTLAGAGVVRVVVDEAELLLLATAPERRREGIAARLIEALVARARQAGAARVFLEVAADNTAALALYRRHGFGEIGRRCGYYHRAGLAPVDALTMARALGR